MLGTFRGRFGRLAIKLGGAAMVPPVMFTRTVVTFTTVSLPTSLSLASSSCSFVSVAVDVHFVETGMFSLRRGIGLEATSAFIIEMEGSKIGVSESASTTV
jgi:hypothetical protein